VCSEILQIFSVFCFFSVKRPDGLSWRLGGLSWRPGMGSSVGWTDLYMSGPRGTNGRTVRLLVRTRATCPHIFEAACVWTALMIHPDGDPTGSIYTLVAAFSSYPTKKSSFGP